MNLKDEEIYKKIEEIYKSEKGKPFIEHLTRSFLPISRSTFMLSNEGKKQMRCSITGSPLIHKEELVKFQLENMDAILKNFTDRILGNATENTVLDNFKGRLLAVECLKSNRLLCLPAVRQLLNFASSEYLKGNKHIGYVINDEMKKESVQKQGNGKVGQSNQSNHSNHSNHSNQSKTKNTSTLHSTTSLGDFDVLQKLKDELENKGK